MSTNDSKPVKLTAPPVGYADWPGEINAQIHAAQQRATQALNLELVTSYWRIGNEILARQGKQGWGAKVVDRLAHDLPVTFPEIQGFSVRNLQYMRAFVHGWPHLEFAQKALHKLPLGHKIGLLLWKNKNKVVAEYALHDKAQPPGVAGYRLVASLPPELQTSLPSIEQIERKLAGDAKGEEEET